MYHLEASTKLTFWHISLSLYILVQTFLSIVKLILST